MGLVLPSSKKRCYLSGADWIINALDFSLKSGTCAGNMSQIVLALDSQPDLARIRERLSKFVKAYPVINGTVKRDKLNLAPYWKFSEGSEGEVKINELAIDNRADMLSVLEAEVNRPFERDKDHLVFHFVRLCNNKTCLAMTFDHRLFDARGAELFLDLFGSFMDGENALERNVSIDYSRPADLSEWMDKFYAGRNVNRKMVELSQRPTAALPVSGESNRAFRFKLIPLSSKDSEQVYKTAYSKAGYLMEMPYLLAVVIKSVHELFVLRGISRSSYLVPVSIDLRSGDNNKQELFLNHVSYLFFQVYQEDAENIVTLISEIKKQMYDQVKSGLPKDIQKACLLTRIAPLPLMKKMMSIPFDGKVASFCFSHVGKSSLSSSEFAGAGISNVFHMPRVPVPPGLGFFTNYFNGRLNLVISYLDGLLSADEIDKLEENIKGFLKS